MTTSAPVRAVYVHVPFCRRRCGYCDFYSVEFDAAAAGPLVEALLRELDAYAARPDLSLETVYVGGGTPTTLPLELLRRLLGRLRQVVRPDAQIEFTVEANPATVTPETAQVLVGCGVNRASIGAQSFQACELAVLERDHAPRQVAETVGVCRAAGIEQVSLDLMFAIPGQTLESWRASLGAALALGPEHVSCYCLTYEPGTRLRRQLEAGVLSAVDPELDAAMYECAIDTLTAAGFRHYEISNFALPGHECRHNLVYWRNEPYVGIGPAAAGFLDGVRYRNVSDIAAYIRAVLAGDSPRAETERLGLRQRAGESAMLELRLIEGIERERFRQRFDADPVAFFHDAVRRHQQRGLLEVTGTHVRLTRAGLLLADRVVADFL